MPSLSSFVNLAQSRVNLSAFHHASGRLFQTLTSTRRISSRRRPLNLQTWLNNKLLKRSNKFSNNSSNFSRQRINKYCLLRNFSLASSTITTNKKRPPKTAFPTMALASKCPRTRTRWPVQWSQATLLTIIKIATITLRSQFITLQVPMTLLWARSKLRLLRLLLQLKMEMRMSLPWKRFWTKWIKKTTWSRLCLTILLTIVSKCVRQILTQMLTERKCLLCRSSAHTPMKLRSVSILSSFSLRPPTSESRKYSSGSYTTPSRCIHQSNKIKLNSSSGAKIAALKMTRSTWTKWVTTSQSSCQITNSTWKI